MSSSRNPAGRSTTPPCCGWRPRFAIEGPTASGSRATPGAGLVSTRLAIFDIPGGWQPLETGEGATICVYNGEVYNHPELRAELEAHGETFETTCDTEVVLRLLVRDGPAALDRLNGQFAFALWEPGPTRLTLIRDRFGVRPLHFSVLDDGTIVFGSEAKAIFASGLVEPEPDPVGLDQIFTLWGPRAPRTVFRRVSQVRPGSLRGLGARADRRRAHLVGARLPPPAATRTRASRSSMS